MVRLLEEARAALGTADSLLVAKLGARLAAALMPPRTDEGAEQIVTLARTSDCHGPASRRARNVALCARFRPSGHRLHGPERRAFRSRSRNRGPGAGAQPTSDFDQSSVRSTRRPFSNAARARRRTRSWRAWRTSTPRSRIPSPAGACPCCAPASAFRRSSGRSRAPRATRPWPWRSKPARSPGRSGPSSASPSPSLARIQPGSRPTPRGIVSILERGPFAGVDARLDSRGHRAGATKRWRCCERRRLSCKAFRRFSLCADACVLVDDVESASLVYEQLPKRSVGIEFFWGAARGYALGPTSRVLGDLARLLGRKEEARRHYEDAIALLPTDWREALPRAVAGRPGAPRCGEQRQRGQDDARGRRRPEHQVARPGSESPRATRTPRHHPHA